MKRIIILIPSCLLLLTPTVQASGQWALVPYIGASLLDDQNPTITNATDIADGSATVLTDTGFAAGLGVRYQYEGTPWSSELGWEYRSNNTETFTSDNTQLPDGNYASNIFYLNGRYAFNATSAFTPWVGGGILWTQEIDLDSEDNNGERSFSDSGSIGMQVMAGFNYDITDRLYITSELRYSSQTGIELREEGGLSGSVKNINYQPVTVGFGLGVRL